MIIAIFYNTDIDRGSIRFFYANMSYLVLVYSLHITPSHSKPELHRLKP